jgi:hypothetical protein
MNYIKVQKEQNPSCHLIIIKKDDGRYTINIKSGSIEKPSNSPNSIWWNYGDKSYDIDGVNEVLRRYGINPISVN